MSGSGPADELPCFLPQTRLSREQLYRSFSENGNPTLKTTIAEMKALGIVQSAKDEYCNTRKR